MDVAVLVGVPVPVLPANALVETIAAMTMIPVSERIFFILLNSFGKVEKMFTALQQPFCCSCLIAIKQGACHKVVIFLTTSK
jgi:hypothetical protein